MRTKKIYIISLLLVSVIIVISCNDVKRKPGRVYMPDMAYSRAYETYSVTEEQKKEWEKQGIYWTETPVAGTIKRGADYTFRLPKDKVGDTTYFAAARGIKSPLAALDSVTMKEAERLYLVNCGICHGSALDGMGQLYKNGDGPFPAKPANLASDPKYMAMPDGQMYYSINNRKNMMGSYASQLNSTQRWEVIAYIRSKEVHSTASAASSGVPAAAKPDSTAKPK